MTECSILEGFVDLQLHTYHEDRDKHVYRSEVSVANELDNMLIQPY